MSIDQEAGLPAVPERSRKPGSRNLSLSAASLVVLLGAVAAAVGVFELTRQVFSSSQAWNVALSGVAAGLIAVLGSIIWFDYSSRGSRDQDLGPQFDVQVAEALTGIAGLLDDQQSSPAARVAALNALLALGRASPQAAGACADVVASVIRPPRGSGRLRLSSPDDPAGDSSRSWLEHAIATWSHLARRGFDEPRRLDLSGMRLTGLRLQNLELAGASLAGADLRRSDLSGTDLDGADLTGADLSHAVAVAARFRQATMTGANLAQSRLHDADFSGTLLSGARLPGADLRRARLCRALLADADLRDADLSGANLREALLVGADLAGTRMNGASLDGAAISPGAGGPLPDSADYLPEAFISGPPVRVVRDPADLRAWLSERPPPAEIR
jgi:uncharacterized protein YjbI with pentapeptide repeats